MVAQFIRRDIVGSPDYDKELLVHRSTPIFLGHGEDDDIVELDHGMNAMVTLKHMGLNVSWKTYKQHGHNYRYICNFSLYASRYLRVPISKSSVMTNK